MEQVKEVFKDVGVFETLKAVDSAKFIEIFGDLTDSEIETMDFMFLSKYGERETSPIVSNYLYSKGVDLENSFIGKVLYMMLYPKWLRLKQDLAIEYNTIENYNLNTVNKNEVDNNGTATDNNEINNNVSAFDSTENVPDTQTVEINTRADSNNSTTDFNSSVTGNNGGHPTDFIRKNILFLTDINFLDIILKDVSNCVSCSVYA